jgi:hypothetical protein
MSRTMVGGQEQATTLPPALEIRFGVGAMMLPYVIKTPAVSVPGELELYLTTFTTAHEPDVESGTATIRDWQRAGHPLLWRKTYTDQRTRQQATYRDSTEFELTHKPDPEPAS